MDQAPVIQGTAFSYGQIQLHLIRAAIQLPKQNPERQALVSLLFELQSMPSALSLRFSWREVAAVCNKTISELIGATDDEGLKNVLEKLSEEVSFLIPKEYQFNSNTIES